MNHPIMAPMYVAVEFISKTTHYQRFTDEESEQIMALTRKLERLPPERFFVREVGNS